MVNAVTLSVPLFPTYTYFVFGAMASAPGAASTGAGLAGGASGGDAGFREKALAAFKRLADHAGLIMVSHAEGTLKQFCKAGIFLHDGHAHWFDDIGDALKEYNSSLKQ